MGTALDLVELCVFKGYSMMTTLHRDLHSIPLADALGFLSRRERVITMSVGQWDALLSQAYEAGWVLLELDDNEVPVKAYQKSKGL